MFEDSERRRLSRRTLLSTAGGAAAGLCIGTGAAQAGQGGVGDTDIAQLVDDTAFVDTHEHIPEEENRTAWRPGAVTACDDWSVLFSHYLDSDLTVAGMPATDRGSLTSPEYDPERKWELIEPYWPAVKNTGYGRAVRLAVERLYGIEEISAAAVPKLTEAYRRLVKPGFYEHVLREVAGVESCQVNSFEAVFMESRQPLLLMQDISINAFSVFGGSGWTWMTAPDGSKAEDLHGYHRIIDSYFDRYAPYAVAVKTQVGYTRGLDFADVPAEDAEPAFAKLAAKEQVTEDERRLTDDHIFWYCVRKATEKGLPVKLHTGYYAGCNSMPLGRVSRNPAEVCELLRRSPETTFVLMHICYPYCDEMIALAKHYHNAVIDMCWSWIISPTAAERFLRDFVVTAPANKLLTFGGDYVPVECVVGHAALARNGITRALTDLVDDGWLGKSDALSLVEPLMRGNAHRVFRLDAKQRELANAPWVRQAGSATEGT